MTKDEMGPDLTLFLVKGDWKLNAPFVLVYDTLQFHKDFNMKTQFSTSGIIPSFTPKQVSRCAFTTCASSVKTGNGILEDKSVFVYAHQLRKLKLPENTAVKNKCIKGLIDALPSNLLIILYWH